LLEEQNVAKRLRRLSELLARELERPGADPIYAESLAMVARLVR
jgi:hypothetical protein